MHWTVGVHNGSLHQLGQLHWYLLRWYSCQQEVSQSQQVALHRLRDEVPVALY